ncbi:uncharacterized protein TNCV_473291 [Trichonephila clavipes]|nr:uncharacterized protein TNCV_473291 [Trichonephila clavipes]
MVFWEYLWPTLRCRRVVGISPLLSIGWWYLSLVSPKRHCCRVSTANKGCRVYPLDPRPDAVVLYSRCTPGKHLAWFCQMTGTLPPLLDFVVGGGTPGRSYLRIYMDPMLLCPGKGLVLPTFTIDKVAAHSRFLLISLPNKEMSIKSSFSIHKAILGIGGEPKSIKRLRSGDILIETISDFQTNSFLLAKTFLNSPVTVSPHKTLNSCRGVISQPDLLTTPETEILEGFSDQGVIQGPKTNSTAVAKSSTATSITQTDENITQIKCPPLQLLQPLLSVPQPNKYPSITSVSTLSSTTQANLLPSASSIKQTTEIEYRLPEPISSAAAPENSLITSASSLSTETRSLTTSNKSAALSTEIQPLVPLPESVPTASNGEHFNAPEVTQCSKRN